MVKIIEKELNGNKIVYTDQTEFLVEIGKGRGRYMTRWKFVGDLPKAVFYYNGLNVGNGCKKRLVAPSFNKPLLARQFG